MKDIINIYVDMDGVQTVYNKDDLVEDMMKPGYFISRQAHPEVISFLKHLHQDKRFNVSVLSAVFADNHSVYEKSLWLDKQGLSDLDAIFVPCGIPKASFIANDTLNILIDDFSTNLFQWEAAGNNFLGIKFLNEANGVNGTWYDHRGATLSYTMTSKELYDNLTDIICLSQAQTA